MKKLLLLLIASPILSFGQIDIQNNLLSTSGSSFTNASVQVDFSFGEVFTAFVDDGTTLVTQGFEQSKAGEDLGVDEDVFGSFSVYPNPTSDFITLEAQIDQNFSVELIDMAGRLVHVYKLNGIVNKIDLRIYEAGTYQIIIKSEDGIISRIPVIKIK